MIGSENKRIASNMLMLYLMIAGKYILPLITLPYLTRVLTPYYYGIATYMTATMTYFQVIIDFGFNFSATREASLHRKDNKRLGQILSSTIVAKLILSFLGGILLACIIPFVKILSENISLTVLYYISVIITVFLPDYIYRGIEKMKIISVRFILARLVSTALTFVFIRSSENIIWMPILIILGNLAAAVFSMIHLYCYQNISFFFPSLFEVIESLKCSFTFFLATFATTAFGATTTFLMGIRSVTASDIACWGVAYQIISSIQMLYDPIISSIYPHMVLKRNYYMVKNILLIFMPIVITGVVACYYGADWGLMIIAGKGYEDAVSVFKVLLPMLLFSFPAQLLGFPVLASINKEKLATLSTIICALYHIAGLLLLIKIGAFSLINIAVLRSSTDFILFICRTIIFIFVYKKS